MALYDKFAAWSVGIGRVVVAGRFETSATTPTILAGEGFTVERQATGRYYVYFSPTGTKLLAFHATLAKNGWSYPTTLISHVSNTTKDKVRIRMGTWDGAAFQNSDVAGSEIHFIAVMGDSSLS